MTSTDTVVGNPGAGMDPTPGKALLRRIRLQNLLSYGPESTWIDLQPLNVFIGSNGSGKSNLISALELLQSTPRDLQGTLSRNGRIEDWIWKGERSGNEAAIDTVLYHPQWSKGLTYSIAFTKHPAYFQVVREAIEAAPPPPGAEAPYYVYQNSSGEARLQAASQSQEAPDVLAPRSSTTTQVDGNRSGLTSFRGPSYPEITYLTNIFERMGFFRTAAFGPDDALKRPQPTDLPRGFVNEDGSNLSLVINRLRVEYGLGSEIDERMKQFAEDIENIEVSVEGGAMQIVARMKGMRTVVPMGRLSDGTLRYLCLLSILCDPSPPPLVCIEEPELGLHPDILPGLVDLMVEASSRTQLVVTTHSDMIVDALTERPEAVLTCEKEDGSTVIRRLEKKKLKHWLEKYRLGELWISGEIGAKRW